MTNLTPEQAARVRYYYRRLSALAEQKRAINALWQTVWEEAVAEGLDREAIRRLVATRYIDPDRHRATLETTADYLDAIETPEAQP